MSRILLLELSHKNLGSATSHLFFRICIGFRFATESVSKLPRLLSECSNLSSHPIFHLSSQDIYIYSFIQPIRACTWLERERVKEKKKKIHIKKSKSKSKIILLHKLYISTEQLTKFNQQLQNGAKEPGEASFCIPSPY